MKTVAFAIRDLIVRIADWFGIEGAWLVVGAASLSVWSYLAVDHAAPWAVVGILCVIAWLALTLRRP